MRKCGVLLPISSLPSKFGIGTFSKEAYKFVDFLKAAGQKCWQLLPIGPTSYGDSPYQAFSTFAGNPYFIDLETLIEEGVLTTEECLEYDFGEDNRFIDYEKLYHSRFLILRKAFEQFDTKEEDYEKFIQSNAEWLDGYALFMAIKDSKGGISCLEWEDDLRIRKPEVILEYTCQYADDIAFYKFIQYQFTKQWMKLKTYANRNGIQIIGDIPIYVSGDSADVWMNPDLFQLDENGIPTQVAGCPPDAFSPTGQLWGNPLYRWEHHAETNYEWWIKRIQKCYEWYDILRIDHFRGFDEYYAIPYGDPTAKFGHWEKGPGFDLFRVIKEQIGNKEVIVEDLGFLTPSVLELVEKTGYPGMKVLQFAFDSRDENDYLPHNYNKNSVVYTGTHDNATTVGWVSELKEEDLAFAKEYLHVEKDEEICKELIRVAYSSVANLCVIPMQDWLMLDSNARMNTPSTLGGNWRWRVYEEELTDELALYIKKMVNIYRR